MFADARSVPEGSALETDLCIVGAGAAGITLAREFIGKGARVTLLESGGFDFEADAQALYKGELTGLPYFPLDAARLRFFGGTTNHWGGVCRPFEEEDFEPRDWIPFSGWPIRKRDVDPYYERAWPIVRLTSGVWDARVWEARDHFSPLPLLPGRVVTQVAQIVGKDVRSFGRVYREEIERAQNVTTYLHANVTGIETDGAGGTVSRVRVATLGGNRFSVGARLFVLAVGGVENPRLLLASNAHHAAGLGNQHDLVGRFFLEHPRFVAAVVKPTDRNLKVGFYDHHHVGGTTLQGYLALSREVQRSERLVDVQVRIRPAYTKAFASALDSEDVEALKALRDDFSGNVADVVGDVMTWQDFVIPGAPLPLPYPEVAREALGSPSDGVESLVPKLLGDVAAFAYRELRGGAPLDALVLTTRIDPVPNPESRVTLSDERDGLGMQRVDLDWQLSPLDKQSVRRTLEILAAELGRSGLGRLKLLLSDDDTSWPDDLRGGWHLMGTTRMSDDPRRGVVDRDCRVHGVSNLFVAGSSVFPTAGSATPTLLVVALALRLAERLGKELA